MAHHICLRSPAVAHRSMGCVSHVFGFLVLAASCLASRVMHVVNVEDLQEALLNSSVEHVVLTQHMDLSDRDGLPFKVHGQQKTIRVRLQFSPC
jgi:hypothetical protein